jgi:hypothetical protein
MGRLLQINHTVSKLKNYPHIKYAKFKDKISLKKAEENNSAHRIKSNI